MGFAQFGNDLYTGRRSFDFVGTWKRNVAIGLTLVLLSVIALAVFRLNPGIEFRGGSEFRITGTQDADPGIGERIVAAATPQGEAPRATTIGGDSVRIQTERLDDAETDSLRQELADAYGVDTGDVTSSFVGPSWGADITKKALTGLGIFLVLVTLLISAYFRTWAMAMAALAALLHDLLITAGVYSVVGFEVTPATVIGFLTILGYSLYDTVVVFDKVRENTEHVMSSTKRTFAEAANLAVNQTLVRSINTSVVALLPVAAILFIGALLLGAGTLRDISLALFVGMLVGTYSSIFIAPALYVALRGREQKVKDQAARVERARRGKPAAQVATAGAVAGGQSGGGTALLTRSEDDDSAADDVAGEPPTAGQRNQPRRAGGRNRPSGKRR